VAEEEEQLPTFATLKDVVDKRIMQALTKGPFNLTTMSPVQAQVLPLLPDIAEPYNSEVPPPSSRDLLVRAKTGTGKTLAFLVPAVEARLKVIAAHVETAVKDSGLAPSRKLADSIQYKFASKHTGTVIISPTRELATQIAQEAIKLTKHIEGFEVQLFVGGESKGKQLREFRRGTHDIIVATPGRLRDMLESSKDVADSVAHTQTVRIFGF
jgi:ATP-dependent RNA helicase MSS116